MRRIYIGIDPGKKGFACFNFTATDTYEWVPLEDTDRLLTELEAAKVVGDCVAVIENVHAMPGQGRTSIFTFGLNVGIVTGMLKAFRIPYSTVAPSKWQKEMWDASDKVSIDGRVDTKKTSFAAARRLFPGFDWRKSDRCSTFDDNKVDSTLICGYAKRMNL